MKRQNAIPFTLSLLLYAMKLNPRYVLVTIASTLITSARNLLMVFVPALIVETLQSGFRFTAPISVIVIFAVVVTLSDSSTKYFSLRRTALGYAMNNRGTLRIGQKSMRIDYEHWDSTEHIERNRMAAQSSWIYMGVVDAVFENLLSALITLVAVMYFVVQIDALVLAALILSVLVTIYVDHHGMKKRHQIEVVAAPLKKQKAYDESIMLDLAYGKEIRAYQASDFILGKYNASAFKVLEAEKSKEKNQAFTAVINQLMLFIQSVFVYFTAIRNYAKGSIAIGHLLVYYGSMIQLKNAIAALFSFFTDMAEIHMHGKDIDAFLHLEEKLRTGIDRSDTSKDFILEFSNVSFKYPHSDTLVLENISFTITNQEKLCIVGENGSGKTTIVKLMLRLYDPTTGVIKLNHQDIRELDYAHYLTLIAPVFQDFQLHAFTIKENLAFDKAFDKERGEALLKAYEVYALVHALPHGLDTMITKLLDPEGTDLSGGESQKLAMVRAAYKEAPFFVLDEPTSNIDPIAEAAFYEKIATSLSNRPIVFISHRMSSAKMADTILLLDQGRIIESGSFTELLDRGQQFAQMYQLQAQMYEQG